MAIVTNMLIAWMSQDEQQTSEPRIERTERVIYVDELSVWAFTIDIMQMRALPQQRAVVELEAAMRTGEAKALLTDYWTSRLLAPEASLEPRYTRLRDSAYAAIRPLVEHHIEALLNPRRRGKIIANRAHEVGCTKRAMYNWLSRYWQRGMTPNALLPRYDHCGGPSHRRIVIDEIACQETYTRRGRPPKREHASAPNMTTERLERLKSEITRAHTLYPGASLSYLFQRITEEYYNVGLEARGDAITYVLAPQSERPSLRQVQYWYNKLFSVEERARQKYGERRFEQSHRAVLGDSTSMAFSPNAQTQIDAFDSGVPLVDALTRRHILGTAIVYFPIDTFCRFITGIGVRLKGPDWEGAMLAVYNSTQDKVAFCQQYGVTIREEQWPSHYLCHALLADGGELKGANADHLPVALGIEIQNTPPYRPDLKAIVERHGGLVKQRQLRYLDGAIDGARQRGDPNPMLDACLTPYEFTAILIRIVLHHNNWQKLDSYVLSPEMIADGVRPYPLDLWQWGVKHRHGRLREVDDQKLLWHNLLPSGDATINSRGIWFKGYRYDCERAHRDGWYIQARKKRREGGGSRQARVAYLPHRPGEIYLRIQEPDNTYTYEVCALHPSMAAFAKYDWSDLEATVEDRRAGDRETQESREQAEADLHAQIEHTLTEARAATEAATAGMSQAERQRDRRFHRAQEQATASLTGVWPAPAPIPAPAPGITKDTGKPRGRPAGRVAPETSRYIPPPTYSDILAGLLSEQESEGDAPTVSPPTEEESSES